MPPTLRNLRPTRRPSPSPTTRRAPAVEKGGWCVYPFYAEKSTCDRQEDATWNADATQCVLNGPWEVKENCNIWAVINRDKAGADVMWVNKIPGWCVSPDFEKGTCDSLQDATWDENIAQCVWDYGPWQGKINCEAAALTKPYVQWYSGNAGWCVSPDFEKGICDRQEDATWDADIAQCVWNYGPWQGNEACEAAALTKPYVQWRKESPGWCVNPFYTEKGACDRYVAEQYVAASWDADIGQCVYAFRPWRDKQSCEAATLTRPYVKWHEESPKLVEPRLPSPTLR
jgi:hypothetical protein